MTIFTFPNALTFTRIVIIPFFVLSLLYKKNQYALILFLIAAVTDLFDGLLARLTNQKTKLGAFLDPLADKFLLITSFVLFNLYGWLPNWVTITVISRDIIVILGWCLLVIFTHQRKVEPLIAGKLANASQAILIAYILFYVNFNIEILLIRDVILLLSVFLTVFSGMQYIYRGYKQFNER